MKENPKAFLGENNLDNDEFKNIIRKIRADPEAMKEISKQMRDRNIQDAVFDDDNETNTTNKKHRTTKANGNSQKIMTKQQMRKQKKNMKALMGVASSSESFDIDWKCVKITNGRQVKPFLLKKVESEDKTRSNNEDTILNFFKLNGNEEKSLLGCYEHEQKGLIAYYDKRKTNWRENGAPMEKKLVPTNKAIKKVFGVELGSEVIICSNIEDEDLNINDPRLRI